MTTNGSSPRVSLVHDYLLVMRGAERTFASMAECWPEAPISTLLYDEAGTGEVFAARDVQTSFLQLTAAGQRHFRRLLPLFPMAARRLPVPAADVVVSSSSAFAHGVSLDPQTVHVCYCHSPFRYAWHETSRALEEATVLLRPALSAALAGIRRWDVAASRRVTHYVANSRITQQRIADFWGRDSTIIHPPVDVARFQREEGQPADDREDYFLIVTELVRHKRVDTALQAARRAGVRVVVVGTGPDQGRLMGHYGDTAEFAGRVDDARLAEVYRGARALVVPNVEEFGIAAVEAQAAGRPVLAADAGGARETVIDGETGVLVAPGDVEALASALHDVDFDRFEPDAARANAQRFAAPAFQARLTEFVSAAASP